MIKMYKLLIKMILFKKDKQNKLKIFNNILLLNNHLNKKNMLK